MNSSRVEDSKKTVNSSFISLLSNVISVIISLIAIILISNKMSTSDMGIANSFITIQTLVSYVLFFTIYTSINRALLEKNIDRNEFFSTITIFSIFVSIIGVILVLVFKDFVYSFFEYSIFLIIFMIVSAFFDNIFLFMYTKWNYDNEYKYIFLYNMVVSPLSQIVSIILVFCLTKNLYLGRIVGLKVFIILFGLYYLFYILFKGKFKFNIRYLKYAFMISFPSMWHLVSQVLLSNTDLLMIRKMIGNSQAGLYSMAYTISNIYFTAMVSILRPWSPWVYRRLDLNEENAVYKNSKIILLISMILCLGLIFISNEGVSIFLNDSYSEIVKFIPVLCLGMYFQVLFLLFYDVEYYRKKNTMVAFFSIICAIINIVLNYIFIKKFGYIAASYTTLVSYFILSVMHYCGMRKCDKRNIYNIKYFILSSLLLFVFSVLISLFLNSFLIRLLLYILFIIIVIIFNRKLILEFIEIFIGKNKIRICLIKVYNYFYYLFIKVLNLFIHFKSDDNYSKKQVLIASDLGLGDAINFVCVCDKIRKIYPKNKYEITILATKISIDFLKKHSNFDCYIEFNNNYYFSGFNISKAINGIKILKEKKYDIVLDIKWPFTRVHSNLYTVMSTNSNEKVILINNAVLKINKKYFKKVYTRIIDVDDAHMTNLDLYNLFVINLDKSIDKKIVFNKLYDSSVKINGLPKNYYVLFPSSSSDLKNWSVDNFVKLIKKLSNDIDYKVVFLGTNYDKKIIDSIVCKLDKKNVINLVGKTTFQEYINIISKSKFVITNDTSAYHIAVNEEVPVSIIAGMYTFDTFALYNIKYGKIKKPYTIVSNDRVCANCHYDCIYSNFKKFPCLDDISVDYAYSKVKDMLIKEKIINNRKDSYNEKK